MGNTVVIASRAEASDEGDNLDDIHPGLGDLLNKLYKQRDGDLGTASSAVERSTKTTFEMTDELRRGIDNIIDYCNYKVTQPNPPMDLNTCMAQELGKMDSLKGALNSSLQDQVKACSDTAKVAKYSCDAQTYGGAASLVIGLANQVRASGMGEKCKKAADFQKNMGLLNAGIAGMCFYGKNECKKNCEINDDSINRSKQVFAELKNLNIPALNAFLDDSRHVQAVNSIDEIKQSCEKASLSVEIALGNAMQLMQGFAQADQCDQELTQNECMQEDAGTNRKCPVQFCANPDNSEDPSCKWTAACSTPESMNDPACKCLANPMADGCMNLPLPGGSFNSFANNRTPGGDGYDWGETEMPLEDVPPPAFGDTNNTGDGIVGGTGGGGGGVGKGSALGGGPDGGGGRGPAAGVYDTNVTGGVRNNAGGAGSGGGSGSGYYSGSSRGGGDGYTSSARGGSGKNKLDLKKYLPGGKLARQRDAKKNNGITGANGLSNFQKVNRAHNRSRGTLMQP